MEYDYQERIKLLVEDISRIYNSPRGFAGIRDLFQAFSCDGFCLESKLVYSFLRERNSKTYTRIFHLDEFLEKEIVEFVVKTLY